MTQEQAQGRAMVQVSSTVVVNVDGKGERAFRIVISGAAPENGTISYDSPLAKAILGQLAGDKVVYMVAGRMVTAEIISIF
jgi:transcription elongation GreA/GreB family factor